MAIEKSPIYFPYSERETPPDMAKRPLQAPPNPERKANALSRLKQTVEHLEANSTLEPQITTRAIQLAAQGFSQETLYKAEYKVLWHPKYYQPSVIPDSTSDTTIADDPPSQPERSEQSETTAESGITDNCLRSVGGADGPKEVNETPKRGVVGGTEPELSDPDSLLCQLVALAGWQG